MDEFITEKVRLVIQSAARNGLLAYYDVVTGNFIFDVGDIDDGVMKCVLKFLEENPEFYFAHSYQDDNEPYWYIAMKED